MSNFNDTEEDISKEISSLRDMVLSLKIIKTDLKDIKPIVNDVRDGIVRLQAWKRSADSKIRKIEESVDKLKTQHNCFRSSDISNLELDSKKNSIIVTTLEKTVSVNEKNITDIKKSTNKFIYWILGLAIFIIGGVLTWHASLHTLKANFNNLSDSHTKVYNTVQTMQNDNAQQSKELQKSIMFLRQKLAE